MAVAVEKESEFYDDCDQEHCCKCGVKTRYWYEPNDVPLCPTCAVSSEPNNIPTKQEWIKQG